MTGLVQGLTRETPSGGSVWVWALIRSLGSNSGFNSPLTRTHSPMLESKIEWNLGRQMLHGCDGASQLQRLSRPGAVIEHDRVYAWGFVHSVISRFSRVARGGNALVFV